MKPDGSDTPGETADNPVPVAGDVIGDTTYSERFVLKILLKLANLDTLKDEIQEKSFEEDLCTLWDMTAERDVVLFIQKYHILNLFNFALPVIDSPRIVEIVVGIIGNMCCQKEVVAALLELDTFLPSLLEYMKGDDTLTSIQVLRLVSACVFIADDDDLTVWMKLFKSCEYSSALYFILKNSSNKELLVAALENFNTVTSYFNTEKFRTDFFIMFVTKDALESLAAAFIEVTVAQKDAFDKDELERILVISQQVTLNLVGFDKSPEIYEENKEDVLKIINNVLAYYDNKLIVQKEIDPDLIDIVDSTNTVVNILQLNEVCEPEKYFSLSYSIWKALKSITKSEENGCSFEDDNNKEELNDFATKMRAPLATLICTYIAKCPEKDLLKVLDDVGTDYEDILGSVADEDTKTNVTKRTLNYRSRLKDNVDS